MNEGDFMKDIMKTEIPEVEVVGGEKEDVEVDLAEQVKALESQIDALEGKYDEGDSARIEALKRERARLEQELGSSNTN